MSTTLNIPVVQTILYQEEIEFASACGKFRNYRAKHCGRYDVNELYETEDEDVHVMGAIAEYAVYATCNLAPHLTFDKYKDQADLGDDIEIKSSMKHNYLLARAGDNPEHKAIFVKVLSPRYDKGFQLWGWLPIKEILQKQFLEPPCRDPRRYDSRPLYGAHISKLRPIDEILQEIEEKYGGTSPYSMLFSSSINNYGMRIEKLTYLKYPT